MTQVPFLNYTPAQFSSASGLKDGVRQCANVVTAEYNSALRRYQLQLNAVEHFERVNNIAQRWTPDHPDYVASVQYVKHRAFIRVVEELEGVIVQRLFELAKANLASTGRFLCLKLDLFINN